MASAAIADAYSPTAPAMPSIAEPSSLASPVKLLLPMPVLQESRASPILTSPAATPTAAAQPVVTPMNVAKTTWRTKVCPEAPIQRKSKPTVVADDATPNSAMGLFTPTTRWPSKGSPIGQEVGFTPFGFAPFVVLAGDGVSTPPPAATPTNRGGASSRPTTRLTTMVK
mmetsp:Transcript_27876/g.64771  ORF Transcript_27876/g.64771 Transcript_27876/m.64771 type:complete len:169 (-) Transcript_27876:136-642(-)|eukprot:CAMPEP_0178430638 /NCGR_PEP_ID=MMETSP0689_2-20121128/31426_1 /TAXON_ID=160604 /ORGANISM="Amphidinium massartii, Strain CS-259" /LENGTH=168 /DNA_ID=CAMNT_0020052507 /DNA_START=82 /DNA_END=588 /DNA_ORIENTATION=+